MTASLAARRAALRAIFDAAVASASPACALRGRLPPPPPRGRVIVLAAGKGAASMAAAAEAHYLDAVGLDPARLVGVGVARRGHGAPTRRVRIVEAGHPTPDADGLRGTLGTLDLAAGATAEDLILALITGGGSAAWVAPAPGVSLSDKQTLTRALLRSGAPIGDINVVRKHLSRIKGGRLARIGAPAPIVTLAISDVPGDDPSIIASGPTTPDASTLADARAALARNGVDAPPAIRAALADPANETPKPGDPCFDQARFAIVARPADALAAAARAARMAGYEPVMLGADLEGEARDVAFANARLAREAAQARRRVAILSGGELTVTISGQGRGGPNQEYALALAIALDGLAGVCALAGDTDGADGGAGSADDPAGALIDETTPARARAAGIDPRRHLADNDSTRFFARLDDLLTTGPTLTNVNDLRVILVDPDSEKA